MEKVLLDSSVVESIEYMREREFMSLFEIIKGLNDGRESELFNDQSEKIKKYFNNFKKKEDDENFMKCLLGYYEIKLSPEEQIKDFYNNVIIPKTKDVDSESYLEGTIEASTVEKVLKMMDRLDIIN